MVSGEQHRSLAQRTGHLPLDRIHWHAGGVCGDRIATAAVVVVVIGSWATDGHEHVLSVADHRHRTLGRHHVHGRRPRIDRRVRRCA